LRTLHLQVDTPLSHDLLSRAQRELQRAEKYVGDTRVRKDEDVFRVAVKFAQLKALVHLREKLALAMDDLRDDVFETVVNHCREARINDSRAVKERLKAIDQPRTVLAELATALEAPALVAETLQIALRHAKDCPSRPDLVTMSDKASALLSALNTLDHAKVNGRKAHAQLLVSTEHDIGHIAKLQKELAAFSQVCLDTRGVLPEPENVAEVRELLAKWTREEGPSRELKAAVAGADLEVLRRAIPAAKESGIGIKSAKKRLATLELNEKIKADLEVALRSHNTLKLKQAVTAASGAGIEVGTEARGVLKQLDAARFVPRAVGCSVPE